MKRSIVCISVTKIFQRRKEDFNCEHCGQAVAGDGYTNHCPSCLYSKHVDVFPGDREAECRGLMEPMGYEKERGEERIIHQCLKCQLIRKNRVHTGDDFETLLAVARKRAV